MAPSRRAECERGDEFKHPPLFTFIVSRRLLRSLCPDNIWADVGHYIVYLSHNYLPETMLPYLLTEALRNKLVNIVEDVCVLKPRSYEVTLLNGSSVTDDCNISMRLLNVILFV